MLSPFLLVFTVCPPFANLYLHQHKRILYPIGPPFLYNSSSLPRKTPRFLPSSFFYGSRCYLPDQAITSLCCSSHQQWLLFPVPHISSMASLSLAAGPMHGEGSPGAASSSYIYIYITKYPLALQKGSTHVLGLERGVCYTVRSGGWR